MLSVEIVSDWCDMVSIAAGNVHMATNTGNVHTIGLKLDGAVAAAGWNKYGQCAVNDWRETSKLSSSPN